MKKGFKRSGRVLVTLLLVVAAIQVGRGLWHYYMREPWTRDAHVRADVVNVAPDVSGLIKQVLVKDNARVRKGEVLFCIDRQRFRLALHQARARVAGARAALADARRDLTRYRRVGDAVSRQTLDRAATRVDEDGAAYRQAQADRDLAVLNLKRAEVVAPVNGIVTNLDLQPGDYVGAGKPVLALVDTDTLRVEGYFEETKLSAIQVGDPVDIRLMGDGGARLRGRVTGIAAAIRDRERGTGLVANINPTFTWVRLAQRVPVRIALDKVPPTVHLVAGLTATVHVRPRDDRDGNAG